MSQANIWEKVHFSALFSSEDQDLFRTVFYALMSGDEEDLEEAVTRVNEEAERVPDELRYELEGLQSFRQFYGRRMSDYTPEQRVMLKAYDENWTEDLMRKMLVHEPEVDQSQPENLRLNVH